MASGKLDEAAVIDRFRQRLQDASVLCGIGDDAAVLRYAGPLAATCDVLTEGTHFKRGANPYYLGRKALAVNLSDLAAMGATPRHALVALTLPRAEPAWLSRFAKGLLAVAAEHGVSVVGGDVCGGRTLSISITALGVAPRRPLYHSGAKPGDDLWVSGEIGKAAWEWERNAKPGPRSALHNPRPQVELGEFLAGVAAAAVDLSDGLAKGVAVLAKASGCGFSVDAAKAPFHPRMARTADSRRRAMTFGEDYQLLFAARPRQRAAIAAYGRRRGLALSRIGVAGGKASFMLDESKKISIQTLAKETYDHFETKISGDAIVYRGTPGAFKSSAIRGGAQPGFGPDFPPFVRPHPPTDWRSLLAQRKDVRVAVAESCTGGLLGARLTDPVGASAWFAGGVIAYDEAVKREVLGVRKSTLDRFGPVAKKTALEMAAGVLELMPAATHGLAITGWAGPDAPLGARRGKVCICCLDRGGRMMDTELIFKGDRNQARRGAVEEALLLLRQMIRAE